eukprot:g8497.t1
MASFSRASTGRSGSSSNDKKKESSGGSQLSPRLRRNLARARRTNGEVQRVGLNMGADENTVSMVDRWVKSNPNLIHKIEPSFFFAMKLQYNFNTGVINKDDMSTCESLYGLSGDLDDGGANRQAAEDILNELILKDNKNLDNDNNNVNRSNNNVLNNDEAIAQMLAAENSDDVVMTDDFIGINLMTNNRIDAKDNTQSHIDSDAELARALQNANDDEYNNNSNSVDIGRRYDIARSRNDSRNNHGRRAGNRNRRSQTRRRVRVTRNNNPQYNNNEWRNAGLVWNHDEVGNDQLNTYEEMLALDENNVKVGLKRNELERLPQIEFEKSSSNSKSSEAGINIKKNEGEEMEEPTCNVCLEEFEKGDKLRVLPCFHKFHVKCIDRWLKQSKFCPTCRHVCNEL